MRKSLPRFLSPLLAVGFVFLLNPYISVLDVLPDFIGWLAVWFALSELAELDDRIESASQKMLFLAAVSFARFIAFFLVLSENSDTVMLANFTFGILESVLLLVFMNDFFGGMEYLLQRNGGFEALEKLPNSKFITSLFMFVKIILGFIPDLSAILEYEAYVNITSSQIFYELASYRPYAILLFSLIVLILGIWWYTDITKYFRTIKKDKEFISNVSKIYASEVSENPNEKEMKKLGVSFMLIAVGFVFFFDFTISKIQLLQDAVGTVLIYIGVTRMKGKRDDKFTLVTFAAAALQIAYAFCFKAFANTTGMGLESFGVKEVVILGVISLLYAAASLLFVSEVHSFFVSTAQKFGLKKDRHKIFDVSYAFYAAFLALAACGCVFPQSYAWVVLWKAVCVVVFIVLSIKGVWHICDDYSRNDN